MAMGEAMLSTGAESVANSQAEGKIDADRHDNQQSQEVRYEKLSVDQVLEKYVGDFGPAQWLHFSLASLAWATEALHTLVTIFADQKPRAICVADDSSSSSADAFSSCSISSICSLNRSEWSWIAGGPSSTVSEFDLVCGDEFKIGLVQSLFFAGALVGAGIFGHLADSVAGRKGGLRLACVASGVLGIATAYSPSFWVYAVLRTATGMASVGGIGLCSFVLATEAVGTSKRGAVGMSTLYFFSMGTMLLILIAKWCSSSWRMLYIVTSIPSLLYSVLLLPLLCESPRWLLVRGKKNKAMEVLRTFARRNGKSIPENVSLVTEIEADPDVESAAAGEDELCASGTIADLFRHRTLRLRLILMIIIWFAASLVYYGVSLNVTNTGFDLYIAVLLNAVVELPAFAITAVLLGRIGRRRMLVSSMAVSGIFCAVGSIAFATLEPQYRGVAGVVCGALGIFGVAAAWNLVFIYTSELFPTVVRNVALGVASQAAQIGAIAAPLTVQLAALHPSLPFAIFALAGLLGGLLGAQLPETLNQHLYETLEGITKPLLS